jgi:UTP--glucose-1-phosphate uridylyltransferase
MSSRRRSADGSEQAPTRRASDGPTVRKAVIPAAGFGTRFLPATKAVPKEMLPVIDTPTIEYVVREAVDSGLDDILIILSTGKEAIQAHFGRNFDLEARLATTGKDRELERVRDIAGRARIHYVYQHELAGLGDAVRYARAHVGCEPFAVLLGDTILEGRGAPVTRQLLDVFEEHGTSIVALEEVPEEKVSRYGIVAAEPLASSNPAAFRLTNLVEKPPRAEAPSRLAISSRYVFTSAIFEALDNAKPGKGGEIQLTDAMRDVQQTAGMLGLRFAGIRHDMGNRLDFLKAVVHFALQREDLSGDLGAWLKTVAEGL